MPANQHALLSGSADGRLTLWDARQPRAPLRSVSGQHHGAVLALLSHPHRAHTAFSCGADRRLLAWQWEGERDDFAPQLQADSALVALDYEPELQLLLAASEGHGLFAVQPVI